MKKDAENKFRRNGILSSAACLAVLLLAFLLASPLASASAGTEWEVAPSSPYVGNTLVITGTSAPDLTLNAEVSFEKSVGVSGGKYEYLIETVKIPDGDNNRFTVRAEPVEDLNVRVKKIIWTNLPADAVDGVATVSQSHVPPWTYGVKMDGNAREGQSRVTLRITAAQTIDTDSEGNFRFEYDTDGMPAGEYDITIDGFTKTVTLKEKISSGGGSGTGSATVRTAEPEEPAPEEEEEEVAEEEIVEEGQAGEEESGEDSSKASGNEAEEGQESEPAAEEPEEEPTADGSFMVWGILGSLLLISLIRKSGK